MSRSPRSLLFFAACATLATLALAGGGSARAAEMVVIATTAPTVAAGKVIREGTRLDLPPGAVVTLLAADGRSVTLEGPGGVVPGADGQEQPSAAAGGLLDALGALVGAGAGSEGSAIAAVRALKDCGAVTVAGQTDVERIAELVRRGCIDRAREELAALSARTVHPALYLGTAPGGATVFRVGDRLVLELQANFDAHVYCYYRQADGSVVPILPTGAADGDGRVRGNRPYRLPGDLQFTHPTGTESVTCFATDRDVGAELPAPLVSRPYEPLPSDLAARVPQLFAGLGNVRRADASVNITVTQ